MDTNKCDVYLGRKLVFSNARVNLNYQAEYDDILVHEEDLTPSITRITSERYEVGVNGQPYALIVFGAKRRYSHPPMRLIKQGRRSLLRLTKRYVRLLKPQ